MAPWSATPRPGAETAVPTPDRDLVQDRIGRGVSQVRGVYASDDERLVCAPVNSATVPDAGLCERVAHHARFKTSFQQAVG